MSLLRPSLTLEEIMERLQVVATTLSVTNTALFTAVPTGKFRYVVAIILIGDGVASRTVTIQKLAGTTYTTVFPSIPVPPAAVQPLPPTTYDLFRPIITCEDATQLYAAANAGAPYAVVIYWDSER